MLGAQASSKLAKVCVNSKLQALVQANGSGDANGTACSHDVTPFSSTVAASIQAAAVAPAAASTAAAIVQNRINGGLQAVAEPNQTATLLEAREVEVGQQIAPFGNLNV